MSNSGEVAVSPFNHNYVFYVGTRQYGGGWHATIAHSLDGGATWQHDSTDLGYFAHTIVFDPTDSNRVYVGGDSAGTYPFLLISTDLGQTWTSSHTGIVGTVLDLAVGSGSNPQIYCGGSSGVSGSMNRGRTWGHTVVTENISALVVDTLNGDILYAGGTTVHRSTDAGFSWQTYNDGLSGGAILSLALGGETGRTLFAGTSSAGVFSAEPVATAIRDFAPSATVLGRVALSVCPDPVVSRACIEYSLPQSGNVRLTLSDATGRTVTSLVRGFVAAGPHTTCFEAAKLTRGIYLVRIETQSGCATRKIVRQ